MPLTVELPPDLEADTAPPADAAAVRTGADLVAYWRRHGLIGTRPDIDDPVAYARQLREQTQRPGG
jgi:hypothetical protein